jgi:hypothetical protein
MDIKDKVMFAGKLITQESSNIDAATLSIDRLIMNSNSAFVVGPVLMPVRINFNDIGKLEPTEDITPRECVLLCILLASCVANQFMDYKTYIKENKLERHFIIK